MVGFAELRDADPARYDRDVDDWEIQAKEVAGPVSGRAAWFTENKMLVDNYWSEEAVDVYVDMLPAQQSATIAVKDKANSIGNALLEFGLALRAFWGDLAGEVTLATAAAARHTIGLLSLSAAESVGEIIVSFAERAHGIINAGREASENYHKAGMDLLVLLNSDEHFPSAAWPTPGEPLSTRNDRWEAGGA